MVNKKENNNLIWSLAIAFFKNASLRFNAFLGCYVSIMRNNKKLSVYQSLALFFKETHCLILQVYFLDLQYL